MTMVITQEKLEQQSRHLEQHGHLKDLFAEFVDVLSLSDQLLLLDIYSAGEDAIAGVVSENLLNKINEKSINALLTNELSLLDKLDDVIVDGDVILMQGAGNVGQIAANLMRK